MKRDWGYFTIFQQPHLGYEMRNSQETRGAELTHIPQDRGE